jgi:malonate decarboxylase delta subunit
MEQFRFEYPARRKAPNRSHVGVVGSGDLEVLLEPANGMEASVSVRTSANGFKPTWKAVLDRFFSQYDGAAHIEINDAGGTPGAVLLRLQQAVEASEKNE